MRQGPTYDQYVDDKEGQLSIRIPLELYEDFEGASCVHFIDNKDGTFTLKVFDIYT